MKNKTVLSIVSFIIVFVMIAVPVVMLRNVDDYIDGNKDTTTAPQATTVPDETPGNTSGEASTPSGLVETNEYVWYLNEATGCGYHTDKTTNKTYFFRSCDFGTKAQADVTFTGSSYSNYVPAFYRAYIPVEHLSDYFSNVDSDEYMNTSWKLVTSGEFSFMNFMPDHKKIYFTYTLIDNCENPSYVLSVLEQNVFFNLSYFSVTFYDERQAEG